MISVIKFNNKIKIKFTCSLNYGYNGNGKHRKFEIDFNAELIEHVD